MRLHWLQHVPFEGLGYIEEWALVRGVEISCSQLFAGEKIPALKSFDALVVMGGPMGIYDHEEHPWLVEEKESIKQAIDAGKAVLGICLGAQLMADALGAKVYPGPQKEIGWFPIQRVAGAPELLPEALTVFHWHGDTFDLPEGAVRLASSKACLNQGFVYKGRAVGLQFHMETTPKNMAALIENCGHELADAPFIQTAEQMNAGLPSIGTINSAMAQLLDTLMRA
ncbi:type 1 glutamine amidotransferase [Pontiella sulfatireligans]|uniref:GMP synthase [glutamine-hydrolyzing] n=1 Tax=Pontiella sulfatireligans TaxID=2750658 RepID=A0A6C2UHX7_9BACT|nr:type 1 glutamine amidotransferase [Pontiella sulfatireligans]VGO19805.1 GMP synthase [glutamine-hydrolyzing] [Pontiella sulfatireligans]